MLHFLWQQSLLILHSQKKQAYFPVVVFSGLTIFIQATFSKESDFSNATFTQGAYFEKAVLSATNFSEAKFPQGAYFPGVVFSGLANFSRNIFKEANFSDTEFCQGASFPGVVFSGLANFYGAEFPQGVNFNGVVFSQGAYFPVVIFRGLVSFYGAKFLGEARFLGTMFEGKTFFRYTTFEQPNKVTFDRSDLTYVSFADSDITKIRFGDKITWGGKDNFTIIEEEWLKNKVKEDKSSTEQDVSLGLVLSVYRNLRENYEFRLRYDEAGKFFIKEMELRRRYTEIPPSIKENCWFQRNLLSLTGLYHLLSNYGESIRIPAVIGAMTVVLSTIFWATQSNPFLNPHIPFLDTSANIVVDSNSTSTYVEFQKIWERGHLLNAFERSLTAFLPLLPLGGEIKLGIVDYSIKMIGILTFGLLVIALRRKFERKYKHQQDND